MFLYFLFLCVCTVGVLTGCTGSGREAITAGPRFMGHHPKACWRQRFWTRVLYLSSTCAGELSGSEASASVWACGVPSSSILFPAALCQHGGQEEDGEWGNWGTIKHDQGGFVFNRGWWGGGFWVSKWSSWVVAGEGSLSLWVGGVLALLGPCLSLQILVVLGLDVLVIVRGDSTLQVGPVGRQDHQIVDLENGYADVPSGSFSPWHSYAYFIDFQNYCASVSAICSS